MVKSLDQYQKLQDLLKAGAITESQFLAETRGVDVKKLPQRLSTEHKKAVKRAAPHRRAW